MLPKLQLQFKQIEQLKSDLIESLDQINEDQLQFRIQPDSWNRLQVVQHLVIVEERTLAYMEKKINSFPDAKNIEWTASIRSAFLILIQRLPFKYKVPTKRVAPEGDLVYSDLKQEWQSIRQKLQNFLEQFTTENVHFPILRHPIVGMLSIPQTLRFIEEHFKRHLKQFGRISAAEKKANNG